MPTISTKLLTNIHEATNNRPLTKDELQCAYLIAFVRTCFGEDFNNPPTWQAESEVVGYIAVKLAEAATQIFQEVADKQAEGILKLTKNLPLNG
jgi:hypothetical protein